jgi:hypothetical protein
MYIYMGVLADCSGIQHGLRDRALLPSERPPHHHQFGACAELLPAGKETLALLVEQYKY